MNTERWLQVCVSLMAALATVMLGTSQDDTTLPVIALVVAACSLLFTDFLGWFRLHRSVAGTAGVVAGINAFMRSQTGGLETQFISVANLLIHLQIILLFQKKGSRIYWQLITLSLLQVVVAAALNLFVLFGPLLVVYTGLAISAMLLFFNLRETAPFLHEGSQVSYCVEKIIQIENREPLIGAAPAKGSRRSTARLGYSRHFVLLSLSTVIVSAGVFLFMPRFGDGVWRAKTADARTGFSDEVDLDDVGSIYESPTVVMRISFMDVATNEPYSVSGYPYFRGGVLDEYHGGKWSRSRDERELDRKAMDSLKKPQRIYSAVRQRVHLESSRSRTVFTVAPACALSDTTSDSIRISNRTLEVRYFPGKDDDPVEYSIGTMGFRNGLQSDFIPMLEVRARTQERRRLNRNRDQVLLRLPALSAIATEIVANIPDDEVLRRARELESHFTSGKEGYKYSLDPSADRDPRRDAVEDFVTNHKSGHCQFFASALALMLRSQGIPSRVVVGYRADNFNVVGNYYQLREMDAHAWVEAAIPADQIPADEILPTEGLAGGDAWVRLDPTPSGEGVVKSVAVHPLRQKLADSIDYMQMLWSEYVLGLNEKRQRKAIYEPIKNAFKSMAELMFSREIWASRWEAIRGRFQGNVFTRQNLRDTLIAIAVLTSLFYLTRFLCRYLWRFLAARLKGGNRKIGPRIEFYRRLEALLGKQGIRRTAAQTPREFAVAAGERIQGLTADPTVAAIPANVVDVFYRVRFGDHRLDNAEVQRLENWLRSLQQSLAARKRE